MKDGGRNMEWVRKAAHVLWRVTVLLLPWQIRWFSEGSMVAGLPWEQGRWSFYAAWIPMVLFIGGAAILKKDSFRLSRSRLLWIGLSLFFVAFLLSSFPRASLQWGLQVFLLGLFLLSMRVFLVPAEKLMGWIVISMIPHALLGVFQYGEQIVEGSKWLGMARQDPMIRGVSVIESEGIRVLRAYGGFPHPNIFGGWLAVSIFFASWLTHQAVNGGKRYFWIVCAGLFSAALVLSFARTAWLATVVGVSIWVLSMIRTNVVERKAGRDLFCLFVILSVVFVVSVGQRRVILPRFQATNRLERLSVEERTLSLRDGLALFWHHPLTGVGPGVSIYVLNKEGLASIPAHNVVLLALDEVGGIGIVGLMILFVIFGRSALQVASTASSSKNWLSVTLLVTVFVLGLMDHFLWSFWSGQVLLSLVLFITILP